MNHQNRAATAAVRDVVCSNSAAVRTAFEALEGRRLLSASALLGADGVIAVEGTPRNDDIVITEHLREGDRLRMDVTRNGTLLGTFLRGQVKGVRARGGLGDDALHVDGVAGGVLNLGGGSTSGGATTVLAGRLNS